MKYNQLIKRLNSFNFTGKLVVIYRRTEKFGNSTLYAKGYNETEISNSIINSKTESGIKGTFQIIQL